MRLRERGQRVVTHVRRQWIRGEPCSAFGGPQTRDRSAVARLADRAGELALQAFLVMYLMSLKLWTLGAAIGPLLANVAIQVVVTVLVGVLLLFRWLGRDYDAAVTVGGFLGFGLSSMPVAMATMDSVAMRYGPSPKAILLIALAGSFFVDLANAFIVKAFLALPMFH